MSPPKSCAVCGDKALGYNFNAVTCESCKAFFRRNALAKKQFTCPFNQNCEITVVTRRFCQKCRLKKCVDIGMKSENIMSEEDKLIKRRKIENNRAKRRLTETNKTVIKAGNEVGERHEQAAADSSGFDGYAGSHDSQSCGSFESSRASNKPVERVQPTSSMTTVLSNALQEVSPELMTGEEMVEFIVCDPDSASQAINKLMRTPAEAVSSLEKIINSQKDALKLISHLISYPGDGLKIISKIMNSPFNALTVFTKFMSSPTDALEIISKIVSSPQDVLQFIRNLMDSPEDALDIMNKFMNTPAEALKIINKIFNGSNVSLSGEDSEEEKTEQPVILESEAAFQPSPIAIQSQQMLSPEPMENTIIHSMLNSSPCASVMPEMLATDRIQSQQMHLSPMTTSPQLSPLQPVLPLASPISMGSSGDIQYHSPATTEELPSTSSGLIPPSPTTSLPADADFNNEQFDIKHFIQNSFPENPNASDSLNSLESVLTEVIRIEFQAFNNLPPETRVKQELHSKSSMHSVMSIEHQQHYGCNNRQTQSHLEQQQQAICAPSSVIMGRDLNEMEQMKLRELKIASEALYYPLDDDLSVLMVGDDRIKPEGTHQDPKLLQVINLTAVAIKRLIKMAKKITVFRDMCQEDQVALLKGGCTEMMIMRSVMTYDDDHNTWKIPHTKENMSNIRAEVLKLAKGNVYEEHLKFIRTFDEKWRMDENIILIMCAIVLFTPTRPRIIHSDVIRLEQNSYYYLLRRYLESVYPGCEAKSAFIKLIQKISDVERLNQFVIGVYLNVNPSQVEPLLREIFDLKNH